MVVVVEVVVIYGSGGRAGAIAGRRAGEDVGVMN